MLMPRLLLLLEGPDMGNWTNWAAVDAGCRSGTGAFFDDVICSLWFVRLG